MTSEPTTERIRVRYGETDAMGHAYYANYLYWFEQARGAWCRARGFHYRDLEAMGYFLPVVEVHVRYKGEVKYDAEIDVEVTVTEISRSAMKFDYVVRDSETGRVTTEGYTWHVLMGQQRRAISIPPDVRAMLDRPIVTEPRG
ncbi:MAG: acyl-CoA thioesterase [Chthonomonas sp.]|nr:acyl-CoA thioesterase [Chthonomonas sp.]